MSKTAFRGLFLAALAAGLAFRLVRLDLRPMHHDEANQALKFGALLESGEYRYDRADHHGPTLYYLTLPAAWARGQKTLAALDERTLRLVPVVFGAALLLLFLFAVKGLGRESVILAALFAALSPALTYYSRFYIQETLFAFFALGFVLALGRYVVRPGAGWALAAGLFAGLSYASKETSVIVLAAALASAAGAAFLSSRAPRLPAAEETGAATERKKRKLRAWHFLVAAAAAAVTAFIFFSSFFKNPGGILESVRAFKGYAARAMEAGIHAQPWSYYLQLLGFHSSGGLLWTEAFVLALALVGAVFAIRGAQVGLRIDRENRKDSADLGTAGERAFWPRYLLLYAGITAAAFSLLRYKTPWNVLSFYAGFVLLAGYGAASLLRAVRRRLLRDILFLGLLAGSMHLGTQNWKANAVYPADERNPYAYAQTVPDFLRLAKRVHDLEAVHPDGRNMLVKVICGPSEQWPLPWYLRDLRRVGYWSNPAAAGGLDGVPLVIASPENTAAVAAAAGDRFQAEHYGLRPGVVLTLFIDRPLWDRFLGGRAR